MNSSRACSIVVATYNRKAILQQTLERLVRLPFPLIVVDNGSGDGTAAMVADRFPLVRLVRLPGNCGAWARNEGVRASVTPYIAFCDDDCWWAPGAIERGLALLEDFPSVGVVNARVNVRDDAHVDAASLLMAASPLRPACGAPGRAIAAFMAGASVVRRDAFVAAGGYDRRFFIGAEEALLALDLLEAGYELIYDDRVVLYHDPAVQERDAVKRRHYVLRNRLWTAWLRRPFTQAFAATGRACFAACRDRVARDALLEALRGSAWIVRERRPVSRRVREILRVFVELPA